MKKVFTTIGCWICGFVIGLYLAIQATWFMAGDLYDSAKRYYKVRHIATFIGLMILNIILAPVSFTVAIYRTIFNPEKQKEFVSEILEKAAKSGEV